MADVVVGLAIEAAKTTTATRTMISRSSGCQNSLEISTEFNVPRFCALKTCANLSSTFRNTVPCSRSVNIVPPRVLDFLTPVIRIVANVSDLWLLTSQTFTAIKMPSTDRQFHWIINAARLDNSMYYSLRSVLHPRKERLHSPELS